MYMKNLNLENIQNLLEMKIIMGKNLIMMKLLSNIFPMLPQDFKP